MRWVQAWLCWMVASGVAVAQPSQVPLLPAPIGVGVIYSETTPETRPRTDQAWSGVLSRGANAYQLAVAWDELASADGTPSIGPVLPLLDTIRGADLSVFLTLRTVDTTRLRLPADFMDPADPTRLAPGLAFDSPVVLAALRSLLDELVPALVERSGFALSLANEADVWARSNPLGAFPLAVFVETGRLHAHTLAPDLAVGATLTREGLYEPTLGALFVAVSDAAMFTYYPLYGAVLDPAAAAQDFDRMETLAGGRAVLLQEFGCPSGPAGGGGVLGASDELQRRWVETVFREVRRRPAFRFISVLHLADWPPDVVAGFEAYYGSSSPAFVEFLTTLGLMRADGTPKPALRELMQELRATATPPRASEVREGP